MIELAIAIVAAAHQRFDLASVRIESDQGDLRSYRVLAGRSFLAAELLVDRLHAESYRSLGSPLQSRIQTGHPHPALCGGLAEGALQFVVHHGDEEGVLGFVSLRRRQLERRGYSCPI